jgi:hypothetical protein
VITETKSNDNNIEEPRSTTDDETRPRMGAGGADRRQPLHEQRVWSEDSDGDP